MAKDSACFTAALAVAKIPPHQPPPAFCVGASSCGGSAEGFSGALSSISVSVPGVKLVWKDLVLSADLRGAAFSSLVRDAAFNGGVAAAFRLGTALVVGVADEDEGRGVCGLLADRSWARFSSSARRSASGRDGAGVRGLVAWGLEAGLSVSLSSPRASSWARSSSSVAFLLAIVQQLGSDCKGRVNQCYSVDVVDGHVFYPSLSARLLHSWRIGTCPPHTLL